MITIVQRLLDSVFGCSHPECSFPITLIIDGHRLTYRTCLSCGARRKYDINRMRYVPFESGDQRKLSCPNYGQGVVR